MSVDLRIASLSEKACLRTMLTSYLRELQQFGTVDLDYQFFDSYWTEDNRWPYFIERQGQTAGFALINTWSPSGQGTDYSVAEFHILPEFRGAGLGSVAFAQVMQLHPGIWEIGVMPCNTTARAFWNRAVNRADISALKFTRTRHKLIYRFSAP